MNFFLCGAHPCLRFYTIESTVVIQVTDLIREVRQGLADCLFCWACQSPLSRENTKHLVSHLKKDDGVKADGTLDQVSMTLLMTLIYCLDIRILEQEDAEGACLMVCLHMVCNGRWSSCICSKILTGLVQR